MNKSAFSKAGLFALILVVVAIGSWELFLRHKGYAITYDDGNELWTHYRNQADLPADQATVFIGASRNKFDIDVDTWQSLTGEKVIQLASEGVCALPYLEDLANDPKFRGKLVFDITEVMIFSPNPRSESEPREQIAYRKKETPAQKASFAINQVLESQFTFLDKNYFSINGLLENNVTIRNRPGVFSLPNPCPLDFNRVDIHRQDIMTKRFETDTTIQNKVKGLWNFYRSLGGPPPLQGQARDSLIHVIKKQVDQIRARGGTVIFVRTPCSGPMWMGEQMACPRDQYWQPLLDITKTPGIHFADYPAIDHFQCPEFSHLKRGDAVLFTKELIRILETEKGWSFTHRSSTN